MEQEPSEERQPRFVRVRVQLDRLRRLARAVAPVALGVLITFLALLLYSIIMPGPQPLTQRQVDERVAIVMASATPPPPLAQRVYDYVVPSLVQIDTVVIGTDGKREGGRGAGVVLDTQGQILTSLHVVQGAIEINVLFATGEQSEASITSSDVTKDIAVLRTLRPPAELIPATLGNPGSLKIGDEAFVIGNPFGLTGSESSGIISGLNRTYRPPDKNFRMEGMIQFDAAVNPGNSGGPLVNRYGEVVGIVTGLLNPTDQNFFVGIGFAVPIDVAASSAGSPVH